VREHHWPPNVIGGLFVDECDYSGLFYWYNDMAEVIDELKNNGKKK
jgi:hypothetical protein